MTLVHGVYDTMPKCWVFGCNISTLFFSIYLFYGRASELVLRASSGIPASYLTCGSSIIQVMLASFKYLLEHKVLKIFLLYTIVQAIIVYHMSSFKTLLLPNPKNSRKILNFREILLQNLKKWPKLLKVSNWIDYILTTVQDQNLLGK